MSRSFKGFLQAYAQELTGCGTSSIKKLFEAVVGDSPRGAEALLLLALASGRADYLMRQADGTSFEAAYRAALADLDRAGGMLEKWLEQLPGQNRYRKVECVAVGGNEAGAGSPHASRSARCHRPRYGGARDDTGTGMPPDGFEQG